MSPLWSSSWAPTWTSFGRYGTSSYYAVTPTAEAKSAAALTAPDSPYGARPSLSQIVTSKRVRYAASAASALCLVIWLLITYDGRRFGRSLRGGHHHHEYHYDHPLAEPFPPCPPVTALPRVDDADRVDWSRFAYTQYVTSEAYLCNSVMIFEALHRLGSRADRVMMYPREMMPDPDGGIWGDGAEKLLIKARDEYGAKLVPVEVQHRDGTEDDGTWSDSYTKLLAFNQTQYARVINVDSDSTILQAMDELFLLPACPVAMPRAYWLAGGWDDKKPVLSSQLMLVEPSAAETERVMRQVRAASDSDYDMEIVNQLYADRAMVLPHRPYDLLTGEFRSRNHSNYMRGAVRTNKNNNNNNNNNGTGAQDEEDKWDPVAVYKEAKFLHFSDYPVAKPWLPVDEEVRVANEPACEFRDGGRVRDCAARQLWNGFYEDFRDRRDAICGKPRTKKRRGRMWRKEGGDDYY